MSRHSDEAAWLSRREFLRRSMGTAVALPSAAAILAACSRPGAPSPVASGARNPVTDPARPSDPYTWPLIGKPIADDTPIETNATLQVYNWSSYLWAPLFRQFTHKYKQYNVRVELTTFNNEEEAIQKLSSGAIAADVTFPTVYVLGREIAGKLLQPLNHNLIPNLKANCWSQFANPWYDQQARYSVPYVIWTTGIGYRRDHIPDALVAEKGYSILWEPQYKGKVEFYDSIQNAIAMALLKNGITDVNTGKADEITTAKEDLIKLVSENNARIAIDDYTTIPADQIWASQSWSGDMVGAKYNLPKGVSTDVLGYWYPPQGGGVVGNDQIAIPASAKNPRLAHEFLNFMLDTTNAFHNFVNYTGYEPPQNSLSVDKLVPKYVPPTLSKAVVSAPDLQKGQYLISLPPDAYSLWSSAWDEIKAGA
jgi:spermidine/putrescine transport system substrate-binding protein